jgi:hypothetical protein
MARIVGGMYDWRDGGGVQMQEVVMDRCKIAAVLVTAFLCSTSTVQGAFTTVIHSPPDEFVPGEVIVADTQINLHHGADFGSPGEIIYLGDDGVPATNVELNVLGGEVWAVQAWKGSRLNVAAGSVRTANLLGGHGTMSGGGVQTWQLYAGILEMSDGTADRIDTAGSTDAPASDAALFVMTGGEVGLLDATGNVVVAGGAIESMIFRGAGFVEISGGTIGDDFEVGGVGIGADPDDPTREIVDGASGHVTIRGGSIGERMILRTGRTLDYFGGVIGDEFQAHEGSRVQIRGTQFFVDGVEVSWPAGGWHVLAQRDVVLTGKLVSGESFEFDLNSLPGQGDYLSPEATVAILFVPEPGIAIVALQMVLVVVGVRRRSGAG